MPHTYIKVPDKHTYVAFEVQFKPTYVTLNNISIFSVAYLYIYCKSEYVYV